MTRQATMRTLASAILAVAAIVAADDNCFTESSPNLLVNPSWENGLDGWNYIYPHTLSTAQASDGTTSLMSTAVYSYNLVTQTVNDLVVGTQYDFSIDFNIIVTNVGLVESCTMYLLHDSVSSSSIIALKSGVYNLHSNQGWQTLAGQYTATSSSTTFEVYTICSPYRIPQISIYIDNAILRGKGFPPKLRTALYLD
ncbi:hypothetical protein F4680DRAFT_427240 [Xylaria scruposa]|nr:hypothetical protein F4680DRAFT_427240 [Xylaria scruposa]